MVDHQRQVAFFHPVLAAVNKTGFLTRFGEIPPKCIAGSQCVGIRIIVALNYHVVVIAQIF